MAETLSKTWFEEVFEQGEARGLEQGELAALRRTLLRQATDRWGPAPKWWADALATCHDRERLETALHQVLRARAFEDLEV